MIVKISLILAACSGLSMDQVQSRIAELHKNNPGAVVTTRLDTKARCYKGQVLTGKEAKILEAFNKQ